MFKLATQTLEDKQVVAITAWQDKIICGYAYFSVFPPTTKLLTSYAEMSIRESAFFVSGNQSYSIKHSDLALFVQDACRQDYKGIGQTLIALSLHFARSLDLPFMSIKNDWSALGHKNTSFYQYLGFIGGLQLDSAMLNFGIRKFPRHDREKLYFYLNGFFDGCIIAQKKKTFIIPRMGIGLR